MVRIYTINNCPYCSELKTLLTNEGVNYVEVNVDLDENQEEYLKIVEIAKSDSVPLIRVGKRILVPEVSFHSISEAVDLTKNFLIN